MNRSGCRIPLDEIGLNKSNASQTEGPHSKERGEATCNSGIRLACKTKVSIELDGPANSESSVAKAVAGYAGT
jgi:hypothetical protein